VLKTCNKPYTTTLATRLAHSNGEKKKKMKRKYINIIILILIVLVFTLEYYLITSYIERMFKFTAIEVKNEIIDNEIKEFKIYLIQNFIFIFLQSIGMLFCLNIGFLYFKVKSSLKKIFNLVLLSLISVIVYQFLIIVLVKLKNWTFTMGSINSISEKLSLENYISSEKTVPWIKLSLTSINLEQLIIILILGIGIHKLMNINYKKAFIITSKTYGLGILLWFVFAMVMEMNFN
jgi:magnesium-transporting ATPase (P-type)